MIRADAAEAADDIGTQVAPLLREAGVGRGAEIFPRRRFAALRANHVGGLEAGERVGVSAEPRRRELVLGGGRRALAGGSAWVKNHRGGVIVGGAGWVLIARQARPKSMTKGRPLRGRYHLPRRSLPKCLMVMPLIPPRRSSSNLVLALGLGPRIASRQENLINAG